ncbi:MAG: hypothetical protein AB1898_08175 [Acidobacteriota bacterium]
MNMNWATKATAAVAIVVLAGGLSWAEAGVNARQGRQQKRIRQGVRSGELTRNEVKKLEKQQVRIHRQEAKAKSDGEFTAKERAKIHRMQDKASRHIYKEKHDNQDRN